MKKNLSTVLALVGFTLFLSVLPNKVQAQECQSVPHATQDMRALNAFWGTGVRLCRLPRGTNNAYAERWNNTVWADQDWLDSVAEEHGNWTATGFLAHEWGHIVQGNVSGTAAELQADCLAGVFLKGAGVSWQNAERHAEAYAEIGDAYWSWHGHGTGSQRVNAARRGYYGYTGQRGASLIQLCPLSAF